MRCKGWQQEAALLMLENNLHPDVAELVGDFTNLLLLAVDVGTDVPFVERAREIQARFQADLAHSGYSGLEVLRDLARLDPTRPASAPVVFTSAIGLGELFGPDVRGCFGGPGWTNLLGVNGVTQYMPMTGGRDDIGPTTLGNALWLITQNQTAPQIPVGGKLELLG